MGGCWAEAGGQRDSPRCCCSSSKRHLSRGRPWFPVWQLGRGPAAAPGKSWGFAAGSIARLVLMLPPPAQENPNPTISPHPGFFLGRQAGERTTWNFMSWLENFPLDRAVPAEPRGRARRTRDPSRTGGARRTGARHPTSTALPRGN